MTVTLNSLPLTPEVFAPFGEILEARGEPDKMINRGLCGRFDDLAKLDFGLQGRAGLSIFKSELCSFPVKIEMVERHPDGSQAFMPMSENPFLVVVAGDSGGVPGEPLAFLTAPGQGINIHRGVWHGVLSPLSGIGLFAVLDRIGDTKNLEEYWYNPNYVVQS